MVAQLDAIRVGSWQRPDVDVWLEGMVAAVGEQAARRAARFNARMRFEELRRQDPEGVRIANLMGIPRDLVHLVAGTASGVAYANAAVREAARFAELAGAWRAAFEFTPRVRVRLWDRLRWWLEDVAIFAPLDLVRAVVYRLGVRPHGGSVLYSPARASAAAVSSGIREASGRGHEIEFSVVDEVSSLDVRVLAAYRRRGHAVWWNTEGSPDV
jgi:hypothetical protein